MGEPHDDEPFYAPGRKQPQPKPRTPGEEIWTLRNDHTMWSCEFRFQGESYGCQATIFRDSDLVISQRFVLREHAIAWSEEQRGDIERGSIDG